MRVPHFFFPGYKFSFVPINIVELGYISTDLQQTRNTRLFEEIVQEIDALSPNPIY